MTPVKILTMVLEMSMRKAVMPMTSMILIVVLMTTTTLKQAKCAASVEAEQHRLTAS